MMGRVINNSRQSVGGRTRGQLWRYETRVNSRGEHRVDDSHACMTSEKLYRRDARGTIRRAADPNMWEGRRRLY